MDDWDKRYRRKVLDFVKAPVGVDVESVLITCNWDAGGGCPTCGYDESGIEVYVNWVDLNGDEMYRCLRNDEVVELMESFG